jgi:hypothetical protein
MYYKHLSNLKGSYMTTYLVKYDVKNSENLVKEVSRVFRNSDKANAFFQEVKTTSFSKPVIEIVNK